MMSPPPSFLFPDSNEPFDLTLLSRVAAEEEEGIDLENRWLFSFPFSAEAGDLKVGREVGNRGEEEQGKKKKPPRFLCCQTLRFKNWKRQDSGKVYKSCRRGKMSLCSPLLASGPKVE